MVFGQQGHVKSFAVVNLLLSLSSFMELIRLPQGYCESSHPQLLEILLDLEHWSPSFYHSLLLNINFIGAVIFLVVKL